MAELQIKTESYSRRCDVCHQADSFDPVTCYCTRCQDIANEVLIRSKADEDREFRRERFHENFTFVSMLVCVSAFLYFCLPTIHKNSEVMSRNIILLMKVLFHRSISLDQKLFIEFFSSTMLCVIAGLLIGSKIPSSINKILLRLIDLSNRSK